MFLLIYWYSLLKVLSILYHIPLQLLRLLVFPLFWKAVNILENINFKIIAATADGASPNRKFFRMHKFLGGDAEKAVIYRFENLFSKEKGYIHFFADAPHLIKQYEIVCQILVLVIVPALCGTVVSLFYGHIYPPFIIKFRMWT